MSLAEWAIRRLIIVIVATATVSAIGAGALGFFMGRNSSDDGPKASADPEPVSDVPTAAPPTGTPAVVVPPSSEATAAPAAGDSPIGAPTRVNQFGVPVGYPHTEAGAISACGNYFTAYNTPTNRTTDRIHEFFRSISIPTSADMLANGILEVDRANAAALGVPSIQDPSVNFDARPIGYQVESSSESEVKILVWATISFGVYDSTDPNKQAQSRWGSDRCQLSWDQDDWKLLNADDGPDGPLLRSRSAGEYRNFIMAGGPKE
ncbi:hypothetical protein [Parafrankia soli]|uniref:hypothetical protein n=1 Tax=Parafrankia soli TaxID=2599596 RepID=UPI0009F466A8|nr:hypothetical protein [Parafrankia soli]